jgi:hypothetical protein
MIYRWAIIDRNGVETSIPEPVNGDSVSVSFTRNMTSHGIITSINTNSLAYYEDAYDLLKAEYDAHGADGRMELKIEYVQARMRRYVRDKLRCNKSALQRYIYDASRTGR